MKATFITLLLRLVATGLGFLTNLLLARSLGAAGYGEYSFAIALANLLTIPAMVGTGDLLVRELSYASIRRSWGELRAKLRWANRSVTITSSVIALGAISFFLLKGELGSTGALTIIIALASIPVAAHNGLRQGALRGLQKITESQIPEFFVRPVALFILVLILHFILKDHFSPSWAVAGQFAALTAALIVGARLMYLYRKSWPVDVPLTSPQRELWRAALPFVVIAGAFTINSRADIVLLGLLDSTADVGLYSVAARLTVLTSLTIAAVNTTVAPAIAAAFSQHDGRRIRRLMRVSTLAMSAAAGVVVVGMIAFGRVLLGVFGPEFVQGHTALVLLCLGQLASSAFGPVAQGLNMLGHTRLTANTVVASAVIGVGLNFALIPHYGIAGAATANLITSFLWNATLSVALRRRLSRLEIAYEGPA